MDLLTAFVAANGVYDVCCGFAILNVLPSKVLSSLHIDMYKYPFSETTRRFLAYFTICCGLIRIYSNNMKSFSYYMEALCYTNEMWKNEKIYKSKMMFVVYYAMFIGLLLDYDKYKIEIGDM